MPVRRIEVERKVMERNERAAEEVRARLEDHGVTAFNLISSPGAGKTTLLERTLEELEGEVPVAVVTGDPRTLHDALRLARRTARVVPAVEAGEDGCHLLAAQVLAALDAIDLDEVRLLFIENVGNLLCPAEFDLGETAKVVVFSVTEGEDKPAKYPLAFREARYAVINKMDLLPHLDFDLEQAVTYAREANPGLELFFASAKRGEGLEGWFDLLRRSVRTPVAS